MVYDRNSRGNGPQDFDYGRDFGSGRDYTASSARDYAAAGEDRDDYGPREYGNQGYRRYDQPNRYGRGQQSFGQQGYGRQDSRGQDQGRQDWGRQDYGRQDWGRGSGEWHGSHASDGRHFEDVGRYRESDDDGRGNRFQPRDRGNYGRQAQANDQDDRGFLQRAGDEVRSWFGDEEAERRREQDARYDDRAGGGRHDDDYRQWRNGQVSQLDRDYHEYRQENRQKFENEFTSWRTARQGQRDQLRQVKEHAEVVGSDGEHVGTVDKTRDDRILLTKNDAEAGGRHHSIPSRWIDKVEDKTVTLSKTAAEAKAAWEDEDRNSALFSYGDNQGSQREGQRNADRDSHDATGGGRDAQGRVLNRSFSGTY